eukprot:6934446-Pyramimonas_sp.AAC.1
MCIRDRQKTPLLGASPRHAMSCYALIFDTLLCHVMLCHAATSDCANREVIYAMVRDGREG